MPRYAQLVMGPAGSGKSTYCSTLARHCESSRRTVHIVNLDPAAEYFDYTPMADIRDLIHLDDAMDDETMKYGPNGGLVFCMEYLAENFEWLEEQLDDVEDDYIIFDCPGQIELYTHIPMMRLLVEQLRRWNFNVCGLFLLDSQFLIESTKFISGILAALSAMVTLEVTHFNVMTKIDLLSKNDKKDLDTLLDPDFCVLLNEEFSHKSISRKYERLSQAMASLIDDYSLVRFVALDQTDEESISDLLLQIDSAIQYGEDFEPREGNFDLPDQAETEVNLNDYFGS